MPIYEYRCPKCNQVREIISTEPRHPVCLKCGKLLVRVVSAPARTPDSWR